MLAFSEFKLTVSILSTNLYWLLSFPLGVEIVVNDHAY